MKVGILTLHNNRNKGSLLQNYSLLRVASEFLPDASVETVDYRCLSHEIKRYKNSLITKQIGAIPSRIKDFRRSADFLSEYCNLSSDTLISNKYGKSVTFLNKQGYDLLLFGSDTIWKIAPGYDRRFSGNRPFPNVYFGGVEISSEKIAYAASANKTDLRIFDTSEREFLIESLEDFSAIGVRDTHTEDVLKTLKIKHVNRVPDPTLIFDIPSPSTFRDEIRSVISTDDLILGVNAPRHPVIADLVKRLKNEGYLVIAPNSSPYADFNFVGNLDPFEYYRLHDEFDFMITNSLHSTIFCIQHKTPFLTVDIDDSYSKLLSKTKSLLTDFNLTSRHIDGFTTNSDRIDVSNVIRLDSTEEDKIDNALSESRRVGRDFLQQSLRTVES